MRIHGGPILQTEFRNTKLLLLGIPLQATSLLLISRVLSVSFLASCTLLACTSLRFVNVISENQSGRVDYLIIHFTSVNFADSLRLLTQRTERPVSSHYLVPENGDPSYPHRRLKVFRLVDENQRAWHAGRSYWRGSTNLNTRSIGIEVVNRADCTADDSALVIENPEAFCEFPSYDTEQIELVIDLIENILQRHPNIDPIDILAHSDIAPNRKLDPGPSFPWRQLYDHGIGAWYDDETIRRYLRQFELQPVNLRSFQKALAAYGYDVVETGELDTRTRYAIRAFQMHFRASSWSGQPDTETAAILFALLDKYRPRTLETLVKSSPVGQRAHRIQRLHHSGEQT